MSVTKAAGNRRKAKAELAQVLANACERNVPAQLQYKPAEESVVTASARFLALAERHILLDKPTMTDGIGHIPIGRPIAVHVSLNGVRFQFASRIEPGRKWIQLNSRNRVPGIAISRPTEIQRSERRADFRVSLAGIDPITVEMVRGHPEVQDACSVDARVITGRMINISATGVAILVRRAASHTPKCKERYFLSFGLPDSKEEFCLLGSIRHSREVPTNSFLRIALAFMQWAGRRYSADQRLITRFIAEQERRLLRLRK